MQHFAWFIFYVTPPGLQMVIAICFIFLHNKLRVFENRVLRSVFGPKRDKVTGNGESCITMS
jgi:hypothetical protein